MTVTGIVCAASHGRYFGLAASCGTVMGAPGADSSRDGLSGFAGRRSVGWYDRRPPGPSVDSANRSTDKVRVPCSDSASTRGPGNPTPPAQQSFCNLHLPSNPTATPRRPGSAGGPGRLDRPPLTPDLGHFRVKKVRLPEAEAYPAQTATATYFVSRYSPIPSNPPSRPKPDCLTPPKGAAGLETMPWLSPIIPVSICSQTRKARFRLFV